MAKEAVVGRLAKAALNAETNVQLDRKAADAGVKKPSLEPEAVTADRVWSPPDGLALYRCMTRAEISFLRSLWQDAGLAVSHRRRPVHSWREPYKSRKQTVIFDLLCIAHACVCSVTTVPLKITYSNAG